MLQRVFNNALKLDNLYHKYRGEMKDLAPLYIEPASADALAALAVKILEYVYNLPESPYIFCKAYKTKAELIEVKSLLSVMGFVPREGYRDNQVLVRTYYTSAARWFGGNKMVKRILDLNKRIGKQVEGLKEVREGLSEILSDNNAYKIYRALFHAKYQVELDLTPNTWAALRAKGLNCRNGAIFFDD